jgi:hypothetical protein
MRIRSHFFRERTSMTTSKLQLSVLFCAAAVVALNACGGGGDSSASAPPPPAACSSFTTGSYVLLDPNAPTVAQGLGVFMVNASNTSNPTVSIQGASDTLTNQGECRFTYSTSTATLLVSPSGVSALRYPHPTLQNQTAAAFLVPLQTIPLADLAGTWNYLEYSRPVANANYTPKSGTWTFNTTGQLTGGTICGGVSANTCTALAANAVGPITVSASSGFDFANLTGGNGRAYGFKKTPTSQPSLFIRLDTDRGMVFATKQVALTPPAVGSASNVFDFSIQSSSATTSLVTSSTQVTAVSGNVVTRLRPSDGRVDSYTVNFPRDGLRLRPAGMSNGVSFSDFVALTLADTGVFPYIYTTIQTPVFGISINKP